MFNMNIVAVREMLLERAKNLDEVRLKYVKCMYTGILMCIVCTNSIMYTIHILSIYYTNIVLYTNSIYNSIIYVICVYTLQSYSILYMANRAIYILYITFCYIGDI